MQSACRPLAVSYDSPSTRGDDDTAPSCRELIRTLVVRTHRRSACHCAVGTSSDGSANAMHSGRMSSRHALQTRLSCSQAQSVAPSAPSASHTMRSARGSGRSLKHADPSTVCTCVGPRLLVQIGPSSKPV